LRKSSRMTRRSVLAGGAALALPLSARAGDAWPVRPIKLVVPFAPGGSNDIISRVLSIHLSARLGQTVVIDNKGGAGGVIGTNIVAKAPPDGYTLLFVSTSITTNAASRRELPYDPIADLQPIGEIGAGPFMVVVSKQLGVKTLGEFIALARSKPKIINYGSAGVGGINHMGTELFAKAAGIEIVHVPYRGIGPAFNDLMAGNLQMLLPTVASVAPLIQGGQLQGLAVTGLHRSPLVSDLPTVAEAALPGFELEAWWGIVAPAHLPADILGKLNSELRAVLALPEVIETLRREDATAHPGSPEEFGKLITADLARWKQLVKDANIPLLQ
jgi:tripartite-type tricarboxylate transporter receptor subunit TctC